MESKFTIGETVMLKSGGPEMTVQKTVFTSSWDGSVLPFNGEIDCTWFDNGKRVTQSFHQDTLDKIED